MINLIPIQTLFDASFYVILEVSSPRHKGEFILEEPNSKGIRRIKICDLPTHSILMKMDKTPVPSFLNTTAGKQRRCDYLLLGYNGSRNFKIFIEMKGKNNDGFIQQIKGAESLLAYADAIGKNFHELPTFLDGYLPRYVKFHYDKYGKFTKNISVNDSYDRIRSVPMGEEGIINFQQLI